jgi:L-fucose mutarotase
MLRGISPLLSPDLLSVLYRMGHGDEIILADAHFPAETFNDTVIRSDSLNIPDLLDAILPLIPPDTYVDNALIMMDAVPGDTLDPQVEASYMVPINKHWTGKPEIKRIERFTFYERTQSAFAVVITGETAKYGNIILKKGVIES